MSTVKYYIKQKWSQEVKINNLLQCKQSHFLKEKSLGPEFNDVLKLQKELKNYNLWVEVPKVTLL